MKIPRNAASGPAPKKAAIFKNGLPDSKHCDICFTAIVKERANQDGHAYIDFTPSGGWKAAVQQQEKVFVKWPEPTELLVRMYFSVRPVGYGSMETLVLKQWDDYSGYSYECLCLHDEKSNPVANFYTTEPVTSDTTQAVLYWVGTIRGEDGVSGFKEGDLFILKDYNSLTQWTGHITSYNDAADSKNIRVTLRPRNPT